MTEAEKWEFINDLDAELLKGGVILSEWTAFLVRDAQIAFCSGANLASVLAALAAIECHLRHERLDSQESRGQRLYELLDEAPLETALLGDLHRLRRFRNRWVHVETPCEDADLLERPEHHEDELHDMATLAMRLMLRVVYMSPWT